MTDKDHALFLKDVRKRFRDKLKSVEGYDGLAVFAGHSLVQASADRSLPFEQDGSFFYLTGLNEPGLVLVFDGDKEYLMVPYRDEARIAFEGSVNYKELSELSGIKDVYTHQVGWEKLSKRLKKAKRVAMLKPSEPYIEQIDMFVNPSRQRLVALILEQNSQIEPIDVRLQLAEQRAIKTPHEISLIEEAIAHTADLFKEIDKIHKTAKSERDLMAEITKLRISKQLPEAYDPIIASGQNAVTLHYVQNNSKLKKEDLLLLDIGLKYKGYSADITRTIGRDPTDRQRQVYDAVLQVQKVALKQLKAGISFKEYELAVLEEMTNQLIKLKLIKPGEKEKVRKYYPHSTSHFLGVDVHDVGDYQKPLQTGMVLTVEPGIYIAEEGIGVRLEDNVLITEKGNRILSNKLPKNIVSLTIEA